MKKDFRLLNENFHKNKNQRQEKIYKKISCGDNIPAIFS